MVAGGWWRMPRRGGARSAPPMDHQPPAASHPCVIAASAEAVGEGAGRPGLARCLNVLPFRRSRPPRAAVIHAPSGWRPLLRAWPDHRRRPCGRRRAADMTVVFRQRSAERRAASRRRPSIDLRKDPRTLLRPGFIARPQPAAIENVDPTPSPPTGWGYYAGGFSGAGKTRVLKSEGVETAGCFSANATTIFGHAGRRSPDVPRAGQHGTGPCD